MDPNLASELVTVRINSGTAAIPYDHVLLTFTFKQFVSFTSIRLILFKCPQWSIGDSNITRYAYKTGFSNFNFNDVNIGIVPLAQSQNAQTSCDNLVSMTIPLHTQIARPFVLWCPLYLSQPLIGCM